MIRNLIDILLKVCIIYGKTFLMSSVENMKSNINKMKKIHNIQKKNGKTDA